MESGNKILKVGAILPHAKIYGGIKRFMEIGNVFINKGHFFTLYTPDAVFDKWFPFKGEIKTFQKLDNSDLDVLFFCEPEFLDLVINSNAKRKIFYYIKPRAKIKIITKCKDVELFVNSKGLEKYVLKKYKVPAYTACGGINLTNFRYKEPVEKNTNEPFVVMVYGRISKPKKGTMQVVKACEKLYKKGYNVKLLLFDSPTDKKAEDMLAKFSSSAPYELIINHPVIDNQSLYHKADVFVSAEKSGGWSNTSAEAMACGTPVIATNVGTEDFLIDGETGILLKKGTPKYIEKAILLLMNDFNFRKQCSINGRKKIELFDWEVLTKKIISHLESV